MHQPCVLLRVKLAPQGEFTLMQLFGAKSLRKQLLMAIVIQLSMQLSGIDAIFYYSTMIFRRAG